MTAYRLQREMERDGGTEYLLHQFWEIRIASPYLPLGFMPSRGPRAACRPEARWPRGGAPPGQLLRDGDRASREPHLGQVTMQVSS